MLVVGSYYYEFLSFLMNSRISKKATNPRFLYGPPCLSRVLTNCRFRNDPWVYCLIFPQNKNIKHLTIFTLMLTSLENSVFFTLGPQWFQESFLRQSTRISLSRITPLITYFPGGISYCLLKSTMKTFFSLWFFTMAEIWILKITVKPESKSTYTFIRRIECFKRKGYQRGLTSIPYSC